MTYWYPGVQEAITLAKKVHPEVPIILGGIYARLCRGHALRYSGADRVVSDSGPKAMGSVSDILKQYGIEGLKDPPALNELPYPAFDMLRRAEYACVLTSTGCPYRCQYCAAPFLNPQMLRRDPPRILEEIFYWYKNFGIQDFAFYDDALLVDSETHMGPILEELVRVNLNLRFHTPNALHVREITPEMAKLLHLSGFRTIRLGLETSDMNLRHNLDKKVSEGEFEKAVNSLDKAGFNKKEIGAYILIGLPGQSVDSVTNTIIFVGRIGATPYLAEYSPIPHTPMWKKALNHSRYDLSQEPLFHNNTLLPCWDEARRVKVPELKKRVKEYRQD